MFFLHLVFASLLLYIPPTDAECTPPSQNSQLGVFVSEISQPQVEGERSGFPLWVEYSSRDRKKKDLSEFVLKVKFGKMDEETEIPLKYETLIRKPSNRKNGPVFFLHYLNTTMQSHTIAELTLLNSKLCPVDSVSIPSEEGADKNELTSYVRCEASGNSLQSTTGDVLPLSISLGSVNNTVSYKRSSVVSPGFENVCDEQDPFYLKQAVMVTLYLKGLSQSFQEDHQGLDHITSLLHKDLAHIMQLPSEQDDSLKMLKMKYTKGSKTATFKFVMYPRPDRDLFPPKMLTTFLREYNKVDSAMQTMPILKYCDHDKPPGIEANTSRERTLGAPSFVVFTAYVVSVLLSVAVLISGLYCIFRRGAPTPGQYQYHQADDEDSDLSMSDLSDIELSDLDDDAKDVLARL